MNSYINKDWSIILTGNLKLRSVEIQLDKFDLFYLKNFVITVYRFCCSTRLVIGPSITCEIKNKLFPIIVPSHTTCQVEYYGDIIRTKYWIVDLPRLI